MQNMGKGRLKSAQPRVSQEKNRRISIAKCMEKECIVPDVVDVAPKEMASICYPSGAQVELGQELTPTQVKDMPCVKWQANSCNFYLLCMTDPDAPSRDCPKFREWHHWLVARLESLDLLDFAVSDCLNAPEVTRLATDTADDKISKKALLKDYIKNDRKFKSEIVMRIADKYLEYVKGKSIANQLYLRKSLLLIKFNPAQEKMDEHFLCFDKTIRDLKSAAATVEEMDIVCNLLLTMPSEYDAVVLAIETLSEYKLRYRLCDPENNKIMNGFDVEFCENELFESHQSDKPNMKKKCCCSCGENLCNKNLTGPFVPTVPESIDSSVISNDPVTEEDWVEELPVCRSTRQRTKPRYLEDYSAFTCAESFVENCQQNYSDLKERQDESKWIEAVNKELNSFLKTNTWDEVKLPPWRKAISCRWLKDCSQVKDFDYTYTYAPVAHYTTIRTLLSVINHKDLRAFQMDVKCFLHGNFQEEVYMQYPLGVETNKQNHVLKLNKTPYGLKQARKA
ncbi:hypothetical protein ILUMI_21683 [Ignelater luminosus]|uniref:Reverse transcriptase Ty1/copia-type domain-containing protein n=1 Tax=Ignelater luminosus TaxID=2038154 RepID=A0A8K0G171_IGNLU|nr:hypothetical protein ILUMI_21683 [Ignelater luminosus]